MRPIAEIAKELGLKSSGDFNTGLVTLTSPEGEIYVFESINEARVGLRLAKDCLNRAYHHSSRAWRSIPEGKSLVEKP